MLVFCSNIAKVRVKKHFNFTHSTSNQNFKVDKLPVFKKDGNWFYHPLKRLCSSALDDESIHSEENDSSITLERPTDESIDQPISEEPTTIDENQSEDEMAQIDLETSIQIKSTLPNCLSLSDIFLRFFEFLAFEFEMEEKEKVVFYNSITRRPQKRPSIRSLEL